MTFKVSIRFYDDREVRVVWDEEHSKWWFPGLDIVVAINEQDDYEKRRDEGDDFDARMSCEVNCPIC